MRATRSLLLSTLTFTLAIGVAAGVAAADNNKPKRGRAHQVHQTGAEDAANAPADAAAEAELEAMTSRSSVGLTPVARPDGGTQVDLEGRFMSVAVAGSSGASCHTGTAVKASLRKNKKAKATKRAAKPAPVPTLDGLEVM